MTPASRSDGFHTAARGVGNAHLGSEVDADDADHNIQQGVSMRLEQKWRAEFLASEDKRML